MKKQEKEYIKWIHKMYEKYKAVLFIEKYHLKTKKIENGYLASEFNYPYLDIEIQYTQEAINTWLKDKKDHERRMIHEFCHTITDPFYNVAIECSTRQQIEHERERLTDHVAQIVNKHFKLIKYGL